jgi:hypothetical protein
MRSEAWEIFWGGLLCGVMDITAALVVYGLFGLNRSACFRALRRECWVHNRTREDGERSFWDCFCIL